MSTIRVHIKKNGEEKVAEFPETSSRSFVEELMRSTYGVLLGTVSSFQDRTVIVNSFETGRDYFFRDFEIDELAGMTPILSYTN